MAIQPLIIAAPANRIKSSGLIPIRFPSWELVVEGLNDSILALLSHPNEEKELEIRADSAYDEEILLPGVYKIIMLKQGTESSLFIYAKGQHP